MFNCPAHFSLRVPAFCLCRWGFYHSAILGKQTAFFRACLHSLQLDLFLQFFYSILIENVSLLKLEELSNSNKLSYTTWPVRCGILLNMQVHSEYKHNPLMQCTVCLSTSCPFKATYKKLFAKQDNLFINK